MIVTTDWLKEHGALGCGQVVLFGEVFGGRARVTRRNLLKAAEAGLDVDWFAREILDEVAWAEYRRVIGAAWTEYHRVVAAALADALGLKDGS